MARHPVATYRLQLNPTCTFADAADLVDYLAEGGEILPLRSAFAHLPVAVLERLS